MYIFIFLNTGTTLLQQHTSPGHDFHFFFFFISPHSESARAVRNTIKLEDSSSVKPQEIGKSFVAPYKNIMICNLDPLRGIQGNTAPTECQIIFPNMQHYILHSGGQ